MLCCQPSIVPRRRARSTKTYEIDRSVIEDAEEKMSAYPKIGVRRQTKTICTNCSSITSGGGGAERARDGMVVVDHLKLDAESDFSRHSVPILRKCVVVVNE